MSAAEEIAKLQARNAELQAENAELVAKVQTLEQKVLELLKMIEQQGVKKNSRNSSTPPSQDKTKPRRKRSLRAKSKRKTGGQKGHDGHTLQMSDTPDKTETLYSLYCSECGEELSEEDQNLVSKRQVVILPPIEPQVVEYQQFGCTCKRCGHHQKASYPDGVNAPIQYGSEVMALVGYFSVFQYVPYQRLKLLFKDVFNLSISEGSINNLLKRGAQKAMPVYDTILEQIKTSEYVGSDETGAKVNGKKWWIWVWQNIQNTFLKAAKSRGFASVEEVLPEGLPNATVGSDRWAAQLKITSKAKQLCLPHLLRDLNYLIEVDQSEWAQQFKELLKKALALKPISIQRNQAFSPQEVLVQQVEKQLNELLAFTLTKKQTPLTLTFQTQMLKNRNHLFTFLYQLNVPPDNNASERAVRNVKVKQKISGQFKSGQQTFCVWRSVIDTLRKRHLNVLEHLKLIMKCPVPE